jgi:hypothetical protein
MVILSVKQIKQGKAMVQVNKFFYLMGAFAVLIISVSKFSGNLEIIPNNVFWTLYIPMLILVIIAPVIVHYEKKKKTIE